MWNTNKCKLQRKLEMWNTNVKHKWPYLPWSRGCTRKTPFQGHRSWAFWISSSTPLGLSPAKRPIEPHWLWHWHWHWLLALAMALALTLALTWHWLWHWHWHWLLAFAFGIGIGIGIGIGFWRCNDNQNLTLVSTTAPAIALSESTSSSACLCALVEWMSKNFFLFSNSGWAKNKTKNAQNVRANTI